MNRETALATGAVGTVVAALLVVAVVPGVLADPTDRGPVRPGPVDIADLPISSNQVTGETATLSVEARLAHRGNPTPNVTVLFRAVDTDSGLVTTTQTVDVGNLTETRERPVTANLTVPREGGYRIEAVVYQDGDRVDQGSRTVQGLDALTPAYAETSVRFTDADALPSLSFSVAESGANRTTLDVTASLTNHGDDAPDALDVLFVLRQADSNIVAARETVSVGSIRPGRTASVDATVTVPSGYNYYLDAVLLKDGVLVDSTRSAANLDPTRTLSVNETRESVALEVSDFETGTGRAQATDRPDQTASAGPGFGVVVAAGALLGSALFARRWSA